MYSVKYHKQGIKFLQKCDAGMRWKVVDFFDAIKSDSKDFGGYDVKQLRGFDDKFRLRIGKFRVIFSRADDLLLIEDIKAISRGDVYK
jgi:mRNA interferase RelE/StbE